MIRVKMRKIDLSDKEHFFLHEPYVGIFEEICKGLLFVESGMVIMPDSVKVCTVLVIL